MTEPDQAPEAEEVFGADESTFDLGSDMEEMESELEYSEADPSGNQPYEKSTTPISGIEEEKESKPGKEGVESASDAGTMEQQALQTSEQVVVSVGFEASDYQGCAPLAVKFTNRWLLYVGRS